MSLQCPLAWHGKARRYRLALVAPGACAMLSPGREVGEGGVLQQPLPSEEQTWPNLSTHLQVRNVPDGALKTKLKVQIRNSLMGLWRLTSWGEFQEHCAAGLGKPAGKTPSLPPPPLGPL